MSFSNLTLVKNRSHFQPSIRHVVGVLMAFMRKTEVKLFTVTLLPSPSFRHSTDVKTRLNMKTRDFRRVISFGISSQISACSYLLFLRIILDFSSQTEDVML